MDYLSHFGLTSEPFSNAPLSRFYFASRQHTDALERLRYAAATMKGLAIVVGDIGLGKTTLARRMLEALPEEEYEAAMLVIVHAGITANWLLKRVAIQVGVPEPADDKLTILSQLYKRLVEIHQAGKRAVVLIDEAQMLATRELMEEFRGLLNLEVPEQKLISFIFFGLPEIERNLRLDPPLAQRIAMRYHLQPLGVEDATAYIRHRLDLAGGEGRVFFDEACLEEMFRYSKGVPRLINTLCDNVLLEMFFARVDVAGAELVENVAENLGLGDDDLEVPVEQLPPEDVPAVEGGPGFDAIVAVGRDSDVVPQAGTADPTLEPDAIAAQVADEPMPAPFSDDEVTGEFNVPILPAEELDAIPEPAIVAESLQLPPVPAAEGEPTLELEEPPFAAEAETPEPVQELPPAPEAETPEPVQELPPAPEPETQPQPGVEAPVPPALLTLPDLPEELPEELTPEVPPELPPELPMEPEEPPAEPPYVPLAVSEPAVPEVPAELEAEPPIVVEAMDQGPPAVPLAVGEQATTVDIDDPLAFLAQQAEPEPQPEQPSPWDGDELEVEIEEDVPELASDDHEVVEEVPEGEAVTQTEAFEDAIDVDLDITVEEEQPAEPPPEAKPKRKQIDLSEIDALLADLNLDRK